MSTENKKELYDNYMEGKTSLDEESTLFEQNQNEGELKAWATFRNKNRHEAPQGMAERLESELFGGKSRKIRYWSIGSIAASIALAMILFFGNNHETSMTLEEKEAMLEQVLNILPEDELIEEQDILYEDDLIVIYYESNN